MQKNVKRNTACYVSWWMRRLIIESAFRNQLQVCFNVSSQLRVISSIWLKNALLIHLHAFIHQTFDYTFVSILINAIHFAHAKLAPLYSGCVSVASSQCWEWKASFISTQSYQPAMNTYSNVLYYCGFFWLFFSRDKGHCVLTSLFQSTFDCVNNWLQLYQFACRGLYTAMKWKKKVNSSNDSQ